MLKTLVAERYASIGYCQRKEKISLWLTFFVELMHIFSCTFCALLGIRRESKLMFREPFV